MQLTMRRVRMISEMTGVDLLTTNTDTLSAMMKSTAGITACLYAMVGGTDTGWTREEFEDAITIADMPRLTKAIETVFNRDTAASTDDAPKGKAKADASTSTT